MSEGLMRSLTMASLVLGVALMLAFEATVTRVTGVGLILAFIVLGVFTIATPEFLAANEDDD